MSQGLAPFIDSLGTRPDVQLTSDAQAWNLTTQRFGLCFQVTVPRHVREWFVVVRNANGEEIWTDWADYTGYDESTDAQMLQSMKEDIEAFFARIASAAGFRVVEHGAGPKGRAELQITGAWHGIWEDPGAYH